MDKELGKRGWGYGMEGLTFKDNMSFEELLRCIAYKKSYREVFESKVKDPLDGRSFYVSEFLDLVDVGIDKELARIKKTYKADRLASNDFKKIVKIVVNEGNSDTRHVK